MTQARVRINLEQREVEIEGSEEFIAEYSDKIKELLALVTKSPPENSKLPASNPQILTASPEAVAPSNPIDSPPDTFGSFYQHVPKDASGVDKFLAAAWYAQQASEDQLFDTVEANDLLKEQGFKLGNASDSRVGNMKKNFIFAYKGRYRISETGIEHLRELISSKD